MTVHLFGNNIRVLLCVTEVCATGLAVGTIVVAVVSAIVACLIIATIIGLYMKKKPGYKGKSFTCCTRDSVYNNEYVVFSLDVYE